MMNRYPVTLALLALLLLSGLSACKKDPGQSPEQEKAERLKKAAAYNNSVLPGAGNLFFEAKLAPNSPSQLLARLAYQEDTVAYYGKVNASAQLEYIHTTVLVKKGGTKLLVTEVYPESSVALFYTITNNQKSRFVIHTEHYSQTDMVVSILDYNWATGAAKTLKSSYFINGVKKAGARMQENLDARNCLRPQPSEDPIKELVDFMKYLACGGTILDVFPNPGPDKDAVKDDIEKVKDQPEYVNEQEELDEVADDMDEARQKLPAVGEKLPGLEAEKEEQTSWLKRLEEQYRKYTDPSRVTVELGYVDSGSDLDFDEYSDDVIKLNLSVVRKDNGQPYLDDEVYINFGLFDPATGNMVLDERRSTSTIDGMIQFRVDPTYISNYWKYTTLEARYGFSKDNWTNMRSKNVSIKAIDPAAVTITGGNGQMGEAAKKLPQPLQVKVTDDQGRTLPNIEVQWRVKVGDGFLTADTKTNAQGLAAADWTLGNSPKDQEVEVEVRRRSGALVNGTPVKFSATLGNPWIEKLVGTWKKEHFIIMSDADYKLNETSYLNWLNTPGANNNPEYYAYKFLGNNTVQENHNVVAVLTYNRDLTFLLSSTTKETGAVGSSSGTWSVTQNVIRGYFGSGQVSYLTGQLEQINVTTIKIDGSNGYTILTKQ